MKTIWYSHLPKEEQEQFKAFVSGCKPALDRLIEIANQKLAQADTRQISEASYDNPNWHLVQADLNACKRCYKDLISLLEI